MHQNAQKTPVWSFKEAKITLEIKMLDSELLLYLHRNIVNTIFNSSLSQRSVM